MVLEVDLKGKRKETRSLSLDMKVIAEQMLRAMEDEDINSCLRHVMYSCTVESLSSQITYHMRDRIGRNLQDWMIAGAMTAAMLLRAKSEAAYAWIKSNWNVYSSVIFALMLLVGYEIFSAGFPTPAMDTWMYSVTTRIRSADWPTLICACNAVSFCSPQNRPILIIRELTNLDPPSLQNLFMALVTFKQDFINFPVFLETSDFLWMHHERVLKSSDSFESYYLEEMLEEEGYAELVVKHQIWTEDEFRLVYSSPGGHMGSLGMVFHKQRNLGLTLQDAIAQMDSTANRQLRAALEDCGAARQEARRWLKEFRTQNCIIRAEVIPAHVKSLLSANILFTDGEAVFSQHRLMKRAIERYVAEFGDKDSA